jgi:3-oxoacyl-(acyl-carrier-protein) synthase
MIGHCLSAASSIESIAAVLQLHQGFIFQILIAKT